MSTYQVLVEVTMIAAYKITAESQAEAEKDAVDRAHDGMGQGGWDIQSAYVYDVSDETSEE